MKYEFTIKANQYQKLVVDNMVIEFYRHMYHGSLNNEPVLWDKMAVSVGVIEEDGTVLGTADSSMYDVGETSFRIGADLMIDVIGYDIEPCDVPVVKRNYFGVHVFMEGADGKINVTVETGLGTYLDTGSGAISHVDVDKEPPEVRLY